MGRQFKTDFEAGEHEAVDEAGDKDGGEQEAEEEEEDILGGGKGEDAAGEQQHEHHGAEGGDFVADAFLPAVLEAGKPVGCGARRLQTTMIHWREQDILKNLPWLLLNSAVR